MPKTRAKIARTVLAALLGALVCQPSFAAGTKDAQSLIFDAPYLEKLAAPSKLVYSFELKTSDKESFGPGFTDEMTLNITRQTEGSTGKDVVFDMFTGDRGRSHGPLLDTRNNIAIMMLMEWDLGRMKRHIKGEPAYFRNRVRQAFRDKAKIEEITFNFEGREVAGYKLTIQPYLGDPQAAAMEIFHAKIYEYVVSDAVPGGLYEARIYVPNTAVAGPAQPFIDERMTFARYQEEGKK
ncbi:MAG: hypothetical protein NW215_15325 [Hyphomicrobiales bacterium]|nr:hypothetical protein [Hyphomicrobiales bacterium]